MTELQNQFWRRARVLYRTLLLTVFMAIGFWFGPTRILFGKWARPVPADYASFVNEHCAPVLRALAAYQRDFGQSPDHFDLLVPRYLSSDAGQWADLDRDGVRFDADPYRDQIRYRFSTGTGGWEIGGPFVEGPIAAPPVPEYQGPIARLVNGH